MRRLSETRPEAKSISSCATEGFRGVKRNREWFWPDQDRRQLKESAGKGPTGWGSRIRAATRRIGLFRYDLRLESWNVGAIDKSGLGSLEGEPQNVISLRNRKREEIMSSHRVKRRLAIKLLSSLSLEQASEDNANT